MNSSKFKILFICLGNYCRSPAAHAIMDYLITTKYKNLKEKIEVDSCGTSDQDSGCLPDYRMRKVCKKRNINCNHIARKMTKNDMEKNDLIIVMDDDNYNDVIYFGGDKNKIKKIINFISDNKGENCVPDPYYGDENTFEFAFGLIYDGCEGILKSYKFI